MSNNPPEFSVKIGGIQLSVWSNTTNKGTFQSVTINKTYKDGDKFKTTSNLKPADLHKVQIGINKVMEYLYCRPIIKPEAIQEPDNNIPF